jgi:hypothetical protein
MALTSPGVEVTVIDESFYTPAEPGTTPLIVVATGENKSNAAGTGTAAATTKANAGKAFKITSQRELVDLFGVPFFEKTPSATPVHGSERNEYGLLAAYSLLGVSNSAFIVRADVDLNELEGAVAAPGSEPKDGAWWVDTRNTAWGIQEWNGASAATAGGQKFSPKTPIVLTDDDAAKIDSNTNKPKESVGSIGDYAIVFQTVGTGGDFSQDKEFVKVYYKRNASLVEPGGDAWALVGSQEWARSHPTVSGSVAVTTLTALNSFKINGTSVTVGATLQETVDTINNLFGTTPAPGVESLAGVYAVALNNRLYLYSTGATESVGDSSLANSIKIEAVGTNAAVAIQQLGIEAKTYYGPKLAISPHTQVPRFKRGDVDDESDDVMDLGRPTGSVWIKTTEPNFGARWRVKRWSSATKSWVEYSAPIYASTHAALYFLDRSGGGVNIPADELFVQSNADEHTGYDSDPTTASFRLWKRATTGNTIIKSSVIGANTVSSGACTFTIAEFLKGELVLAAPKTVSFNALGDATDAETIAAAINNAGFTHVEADITADNELLIYHKTGGDFRITDGTNTPIADMFSAYDIDSGEGTQHLYATGAGASEDFVASNWIPLASDDFEATGSEPLAEPEDGQLWYNPAFDEVDIMIHNGTTWVGYRYNGGVAAFGDAAPYYAVDGTDPNGPIVSASEPTKQSDGTPLKNGDLWISTADLENFPTIYKYDGLNLEWVLVDKTDQTTEEGILFADARYGLAGATGNTAASIKDLLTSNYLDPDAPDPALYPKGMLLWNLRRSGGNVKRYNNGYINTAQDNTRFDPGQSGGESMAGYETDRWTTASPNNEDGSGSFGRKAQRSVVIAAMKSVVDTSSEIRDEERRNFNLITAPGYPELLSNMINLNIDRGLTAFVVGDTPLRLPSDATSLNAWGTNANGALDNNDVGIVSYDEYCAVYYPNGFTTDLGGSNAVVPASHMMLKTIALSDQVSYPWFAPAGTRRGGITNATAVGYIDSLTGEFQSVALNEGQRDTLYELKVNPIPFFVGVGLVAYGQKTRARNASALDRINVARLVVYLRSQLNKLARPYIFEPNDKITRDEIKGAVESLLLELVGLRALYDFAVVCDESNNTPSRIDRNELYVDIAIEPTKAVEFIYIPLRVKNTGEI